jgi:hypothetical protein
LKATAAIENEDYYGTNKEYDLDNFEREGYEVVFEGEDEDFKIDTDDDGEGDW